MSNIADRVLSNPRRTKKPPATYCSPTEYYRRVRTAYAHANCTSDYHCVDIYLAAAGLPDDQETQELLRRLRDPDYETSTAEFVTERDEILSRKIPGLREQGLLPVLCTKGIQELVNFYAESETTQSFWRNYQRQATLSVEAAAVQNRFIEGLQVLLGRDLTDENEMFDDDIEAADGELEIDATIGAEVVAAVHNNEAVVETVFSCDQVHSNGQGGQGCDDSQATTVDDLLLDLEPLHEGSGGDNSRDVAPSPVGSSEQMLEPGP